MMDAADAGASRFAYRRERRQGPAARGPCAEVCLDQADQPARIEVADGDQHGVFGYEVTAVVLDGVVAGQPGDFTDPAPRVAGQRMGCRRPCFGSSARRGRPDLRGRRSARRQCARQPSSGLPAGKTGRIVTSASSSTARARSSRQTRSELPVAPLSSVPPTSSIASASSCAVRVRRPLFQQTACQAGEARLGLAQETGVGDRARARQLPGPACRSKISRKPLSSTMRRGL